MQGKLISNLQNELISNLTKGLIMMGIEIVLKIAGVGILVAAACQLLKQTGRDDIAMITALAGLIIVLTMAVGLISTLFNNIRSIFKLF